MRVKDMDRDQKSMLLYMETRCVDHNGILDDQQTNDADNRNLSKWAETGFISTRYRHDHNERGHNRVVRLSEEAWILAHQLRKEQAAQMPSDIWGEDDD